MGYLLRRSGIAVAIAADLFKWKADLCVEVGIGVNHQEIDVMHQEWPDCKFIGFEACKSVSESLTDFPGPVHNVAISDYIGSAVLKKKAHHADGSTILSLEEGQGYTTQDVEVATLDAFFPEGAPKDKNVLLWVDCEGCELAALRGGEHFVESVDIINIELTFRPPSKDWATPLEIHRWLVDHGFFIQWIHTQRITAGQCDYIYVRRHMFHPQFCCVPHELERFPCIQG